MWAHLQYLWTSLMDLWNFANTNTIMRYILIIAILALVFDKLRSKFAKK